MSTSTSVDTRPPDWWRGSGTHMTAERPVPRAAFQDGPAPGRVGLGSRPAVKFGVPPDYYAPGVWDYDRDGAAAAVGASR